MMKKLIAIFILLVAALTLAAQTENNETLQSVLKIHGSADGYYTDLPCRDTVLTIAVESSSDYFVHSTESWCVVANQTMDSFDLVINMNEDLKVRGCIVRVSSGDNMAPIAISQMPEPFLQVNKHADAVTYHLDTESATLLFTIESFPEYEVVSTPLWMKASRTDKGLEVDVEAYKKKMREGTIVIASGDNEVDVTIVQKRTAWKTPSLAVKISTLAAFCAWGLFAVLVP